MKRIVFLLITVLLSSFYLANAQQMNLPAPNGQRFTLTEKVWPQAFGQAHVCLWNDDKLAAASITIDDNIEPDHDFWRSKATEHNLKFTWFVIDESVADWNKFQILFDEGHDIQGHDDANATLPDADYQAALEQTQNAINTNIIGANCTTYAYPFGEGKEDIAKNIFISMRGTYGTLNKANEINYLKLNSISHHISDQTKLEEAKFKLDILLDSTKTLWNVPYYRGWFCAHFHTVTNQTLTGQYLDYLATKTDSIWLGGYSEIAKYGQSRDSHTLNVTSVNADNIKFSLTDGMIDAYYTFPLTVKIRVSDNWVSVSSVQNGNIIESTLITHQGNKYVLVKAVPDAGEVIVTGTLSGSGNNPPVLSTIGNKTVSENQILNVNIVASDIDNDALTFYATNLPSFCNLIDNENNTATLNIEPQSGDASTYNNIIISVSDGTDFNSETISIIVNEASGVQVINITASPEDGFVSDINLVTTNNPQITGDIKIGKSDAAGNQNCTSGIIPFELPTIPASKHLSSANLKVYVSYGREWLNSNVDLYGLDYKNLPTISADDYYTGNFEDVNDSDFPIEDDYFTKNSAIGTLDTPRWEETNETGNLNLKDYISNQYLNGAVAGDYVFLRLSIDNVDITGSQYFRADEGNMLHPAVLSLTFSENTSKNTINEIVEYDVNVFPNPIKNGVVNVKFSNNKIENANISIIDIQGKVLFNKSVASIEKKYSFNVDFKKGLYVLKVKFENKIIYKKMIVN